MRIYLLLSCLFLSACATAQLPRAVDQEKVPAPNYSNGSLWQASSVSIAEDMKARRKGDTLTIVIAEAASASKQAASGNSRKTSISAGIPNFMGLETNMTGFKNWMDLSNLVNASTNSKFDGAGSTSRKDDLNATITAKVVDVFANGNLSIEGRRNVKVNNEEQIIILNGTVRPWDISPDNVVMSSSVADAHITYSGNGLISSSQNSGWLTQILDFIWPL